MYMKKLIKDFLKPNIQILKLGNWEENKYSRGNEEVGGVGEWAFVIWDLASCAYVIIIYLPNIHDVLFTTYLNFAPRQQ